MPDIDAYQRAASTRALAERWEFSPARQSLIPYLTSVIATPSRNGEHWLYWQPDDSSGRRGSGLHEFINAPDGIPRYIDYFWRDSNDAAFVPTPAVGDTVNFQLRMPNGDPVAFVRSRVNFVSERRTTRLLCFDAADVAVDVRTSAMDVQSQVLFQPGFDPALGLVAYGRTVDDGSGSGYAGPDAEGRELVDIQRRVQIRHNDRIQPGWFGRVDYFPGEFTVLDVEPIGRRKWLELVLERRVVVTR